MLIPSAPLPEARTYGSNHWVLKLQKAWEIIWPSCWFGKEPEAQEKAYDLDCQGQGPAVPRQLGHATLFLNTL